MCLDGIKDRCPKAYEEIMRLWNVVCEQGQELEQKTIENYNMNCVLTQVQLLDRSQPYEVGEARPDGELPGDEKMWMTPKDCAFVYQSGIQIGD